MSGQTLGQLQPFTCIAAAIFPQECVAQLASFEANLTPFFIAPAEFSLPRVDRVIGAAIAAATAVYALIACCGYATYGGEVGHSHGR